MEGKAIIGGQEGKSILGGGNGGVAARSGFFMICDEIIDTFLPLERRADTRLHRLPANPAANGVRRTITSRPLCYCTEQRRLCGKAGGSSEAFIKSKQEEKKSPSDPHCRLIDNSLNGSQAVKFSLFSLVQVSPACRSTPLDIALPSLQKVLDNSPL